MTDPLHLILDPWHRLRRLTPARIALGRAGGSLPTAEVVAFNLDHAAARDAVHSELDLPDLERAVLGLELPVLHLQSAVVDRQMYLLRPDLGRRLNDEGIERLRVYHRTLSARVDVAIIVADGLSAFAAQDGAPSVLKALVPLLRSAGLSLGPLSLVRYGRVALQDEIGSLLRARIALILLGERPGLGSADSLGAYLVHDPQPGRVDADRNCVSSIRTGGLPHEAAARTLHYLISEALRRGISGIHLKDERTELTSAPPASIGSLTAEKNE